MSEKLPVVGSSAKTTAFCVSRLDLGILSDGDPAELWLDGNGKITAGNGTLAEPKPNSFSLPAAGISGMTHCPQSTEVCRKACYVENLRGAQPELYAKYEQNAITIRDVLANPADARHAAETLAAWIREYTPHGFRWHVSGDVFSLAYAEWIAEVCRRSPLVDHWIYTRSFDFLEPLADVATIVGGNLSINLSCDRDNYAEARAASAWHGSGYPDGLRLCYLVVEGDRVPDDLREDDVIFPDYALRPRAAASLADSEWWQSITPFQRGLVCPVDAFGKSERRRCGPCDRCLK